MDEFDFLNDQNKEKPTMFVEFFKKELKEREEKEKQLKKETVSKTSSNQEQCKFAENQNGGYSRTKVLASKPRDREI